MICAVFRIVFGSRELTVNGCGSFSLQPFFRLKPEILHLHNQCLIISPIATKMHPCHYVDGGFRQCHIALNTRRCTILFRRIA